MGHYKALQTAQAATQKCNHTTQPEEEWFYKNHIRPSLKMGQQGLPFKMYEMEK